MSHPWGRKTVRRPFGSSFHARRPQALQFHWEGMESRCLMATLNATVQPINVSEGVNSAIQIGTITDSDPSAAASLAALINWGDGTTASPGTIQQTGPTTYTVTATHTFAEESGSTVPPFAFTVTLAVTDVQNMLTTQATGPAFVVDAPLSPGNPVSPGAPQIFNAVGTTNVPTAIGNYETAIGGADNGGTTAPQSTGFRHINWDAVKLDGTDFGGAPNTTVISQGNTVGIPLNRFQTRGVYFGAVYAVSGNGFSTVNPSVSGLFSPFSPNNTFAMFNDNGIDFKFVAPSATGSTIVSAQSRGFGAVFVNVEQPNTTSIEFFHGSTSLGKIFAPVGAKGQPEFVGELFNSPVVTNVLLTLGTGVIFKFDGTTFTSGGADNPPAGQNLVVTDDWFYPEPVPSPNGFPILSGGQGTTNAPPIVAASAGTPFTGTVASFSDLDPAGNAHDYTATINWGDGHLTNGVVTANGQGGFNVSGTNTYAQAGAFPINVDIADFGGGPGAGGSNPFLMVNNTASVGKVGTTITLQAPTTSVAFGKPVTLTATVKSTGAAPIGLVTFLDGTTPLSSVPVNASGQATLTTTLGAGKHKLTAVFAGDTSTITSTSTVATVTVKAAPPPPVAPDGPVILRVERRGIFFQPTRLVLTFNKALDRARAEDVGNYQLVQLVPGGLRRVIPITAATYDRATNTVTLKPREAIPVRDVLQLTVDGKAPHGVSDTAGHLLDGAQTGHPGSNFVSLVDRSNLVIPITIPGHRHGRSHASSL